MGLSSFKFAWCPTVRGIWSSFCTTHSILDSCLLDTGFKRDCHVWRRTFTYRSWFGLISCLSLKSASRRKMSCCCRCRLFALSAFRTVGITAASRQGRVRLSRSQLLGPRLRVRAFDPDNVNTEVNEYGRRTRSRRAGFCVKKDVPKVPCCLWGTGSCFFVFLQSEAYCIFWVRSLNVIVKLNCH